MTEDKKNALTAPFRADQIRTRQGRSGQQLAYVEIADVVERLNDVLPSWSFEVVSHQILDDEVVVHARLRAGDVVKEDFGTHEITRSKHDGSAVCIGENIKAAASDGLKRAARLMGVALDLYRGGTEPEPRALHGQQRRPQLSAPQYATPAQLAKLRQVAAQKRIDLDVVVFERLGLETAQLSKSDASNMIDELLSNAPKNGTHVNGHAHRHA